MVEFFDCIRVQPGSLTLEMGQGGGGPFGGGYVGPQSPIDPVLSSGNPPGTPGGPPWDEPDDPQINIPLDITCYLPPEDNSGRYYPEGGSPTQTFTFPGTEFILANEPQFEGATYHVIVPTGGSKEEALHRMDLGIGILGDYAQLGNIPGGSVTATIINLPNYTTSIPSIEVTIPVDGASLNYYNQHSPHGSIIGSFDILYLVDIPGGAIDYVEFHRDHFYFQASVKVVTGTYDDTPSIVYPDAPLTVHYNAAPGSPVEVVAPLEYELYNNSITGISVQTLPFSSNYDQGVPPEGYVTVDPVGGSITLYPFEGEFAVSPNTLNLQFNFSNASPIIIQFGINVVSDTLSEPEFSYAGQEGTVFYGETGVAPQSSIVPTVWKTNGNNVTFSIAQLNVFPQGCSTQNVCWPSLQGDFSPEILWSGALGIITLAPWDTISPENFPGATLSFTCNWETNNGGGLPEYSGFWALDIPMNYEESTGENLAMTAGGGGGEEMVPVYNKVLGGNLLLPKNYTSLRGTKNKNTNKLGRGSRVVGSFVRPQGFQRIEKSSVPVKEEAKRLEGTIYFDGIRNSNYTFFNTFTPAPSINTIPVASMSSIFNPNTIDFVVNDILTISRGFGAYNDYSYNSLTSQKIKTSLDRGVINSLGNRVALNGAPFLDYLSKDIKSSVIADENDRYTIEELKSLPVPWEKGGKLTLSTDDATNHKAAINILLNDSTSLNVEQDDILLKNRLLNWKILAEDVDKNIKLKTADGVETTLYIPNNETIPVYDATGGAHTLEMQDGDYFIADPVTGDDRLTVYSDRDKAVVLSPENIEKSTRLFGQDYFIDLTCSSEESNLIELDVDTTGTRQDYYFLALDKSTLADEVPESLMFSKTSATYNYITETSAIDNFVKHKAFPYLTAFVRDDDIIINHLESSLKADLVFIEPSIKSLPYLTDKLLVRRIPWYIVLIPTDRTQNLMYQQRSKMNSFSSRTLALNYSPSVSNKGSLGGNTFLNETVTTTGGVNFGVDVKGNAIYQENREYSMNFTNIIDYRKYKNGIEVLPRKLHPVNALMKKLNTLKTELSLTERDHVTFYDLFTRLTPSEFRSLPYDVDILDQFLNKLRVNKIAETKTINKEKFVSVKDVPSVPGPPRLIAPDIGGVVFSKQATVVGDPTEGRTEAPGERGGGSGGGPSY